MKKTVKLLSFIMTLVTLLSLLAIPGLAASTTAFDKLTTTKYAKTYTLATSGTTIPYTNKYLNTRGTVSYGKSSKAYIDNKYDELYVFDVGYTNGKYWAYVSYPSGSKRVNAYIHLSAISANNSSHTLRTSTGKFYCSLRSNTSNSSSYYVAKNDPVYLISKSGSKYQILYPISGNKWRLAWCNASDYNKYCGTSTTASNNTASNTTSSGWRMPMNNAYCTWRSYTNMSWATYNKDPNGRTYHLGIDIYGTNGTVYAAANGKVVKTSTSTSGANGRFIIIEHTVSGKKVYSFYAHLSKINVSAGQTVSKGTKIGTAGGSGYGSNYYYGTHLHFAIVDTLWTSGGYYGYSTRFTGNKRTYGGVTYYNPVYVINNNRLP